MTEIEDRINILDAYYQQEKLRGLDANYYQGEKLRGLDAKDANYKQSRSKKKEPMLEE